MHPEWLLQLHLPHLRQLLDVGESAMSENTWFREGGQELRDAVDKGSSQSLSVTPGCLHVITWCRCSQTSHGWLSSDGGRGTEYVAGGQEWKLNKKKLSGPTDLFINSTIPCPSRIVMSQTNTTSTDWHEGERFYVWSGHVFSVKSRRSKMLLNSDSSGDRRKMTDFKNDLLRAGGIYALILDVNSELL